jgi:hypothetical protein
MTKKAQKTPVKKTQIVEITIKRTFQVPEGTEILKNKKHGIHIVNKKQLLDAYPDLDLFQLDEIDENTIQMVPCDRETRWFFQNVKTEYTSKKGNKKIQFEIKSGVLD